MSTNRTLVQLFSVETVAPAEDGDGGEDLVLEGFETGVFGVLVGDRPQVVGHERADGPSVLRSPDAGAAVDLVRHGDGDVPHDGKVAQGRRNTEARTDGRGRTYHHGALRSELIAAGLDLVASEGVAGVSLRRLAREAGVSPGAPYHHFPDRAALFAAIIVEGHGLLHERLAAAREAASDPVATLPALLVAYAGFAAEHPAHTRVMLRPELGNPSTHPEVTESSGRPIELLQAAIAQAQRIGALPIGDPEPYLHLLWSLAIGYVTLWLDGPVEARCTSLGTTPDEMIKRVAAAVEELIRRSR